MATGIRDTLSEMNSKEESKTEEEKELLRMVEQAERDEALARKLQQELDSSPGQNRIIEDEKDAEFAWRLQVGPSCLIIILFVIFIDTFLRIQDFELLSNLGSRTYTNDFHSFIHSNSFK